MSANLDASWAEFIVFAIYVRTPSIVILLSAYEMAAQPCPVGSQGCPNLCGGCYTLRSSDF